MTAARGALAAVALLVAGRAVAAPLTVWVLPSLARVMRGDAPGNVASATLYAARGEYEPFQVAIRAPASGLTNVRVAASDLTGAAGRIASLNLTLFLERYVDVPRSTHCPYPGGNCPGPAGLYPDGLVPLAIASDPNRAAVPFSVAAGENQPIWIDVLVPRAVAPGVYSGTLTVTADQGSATIPVQLTVWAFELPAKPALRSSFGLHGAQNDRVHQSLLLLHRIMPWQVEPPNAAPLLEQGLNVGGLQLVSNQSGCVMDPAPTVSRLGRMISGYPAELDLYVYVADEPPSKCSNMTLLVSQLQSWARSIHQTRARMLVTVPPTASLLDDGAGRSAVDIWVMLPKQWNPADRAFQTARARGDEIWAYTALVQDPYSPKWAIDFAPINYRMLMGFLAQSLGLQGILYWNVNQYGADPWSNPMYVCCGGHSYAGEGLLIYPGARVGVDGPVASMRLKWIREGVDDYDYVQLLREAGRGDFALQISRSVGADWRHWSRDPAVLERARVRLGEELSRAAESRAAPKRERPPMQRMGGRRSSRGSAR